MPLLDVTLGGVYEGQTVINRWNYVGTGVPESGTLAFHLNAALGFHPVDGVPGEDTLLAAIIQVQSASMGWVQALALDPYDPENFDDAPFTTPVVGVDTGGTPAAPFLALGFRTNRVRLDVSRGTKRIPGLTEGIMSSGGVIEGTFTPAVELIASRMSETLIVTDGGATLTFVPSICKKERYAVPDTDPVRYAYRYWRPINSTGEALQLADTVGPVTWVAYPSVRSQTSRQYGRGV